MPTLNYDLGTATGYGIFKPASDWSSLVYQGPAGSSGSFEIVPVEGNDWEYVFAASQADADEFWNGETNIQKGLIDTYDIEGDSNGPTVRLNQPGGAQIAKARLDDTASFSVSESDWEASVLGWTPADWNNENYAGDFGEEEQIMHPTFIGSGTTPRTSDTRWMLLQKILGSLQNRPGANPANNPRRKDTIWMIRRKIVRARAG